MKKQTIILDCDGVLYPLSELPTEEIILAMKKTFGYWGIPEKEQKTVSLACKEQGQQGMFNYIYKLLRKREVVFGVFCQDVVDQLDYSRITPNPVLADVLVKLSEKYEIVVCSNNHRLHIDKVFNALFGAASCGLGLRVFDITSTKVDDVFYPKQHPKGLEMICKRLQRSPQDCCLLDDSPVNIAAAKNLQMPAILISEENSLCNAILSLPF